MKKNISAFKFSSIIRSKIKNICVYTNKSFKDLTTFRIGGKIRCLIEIKDVDTLLKVFAYIKEYNMQYFILGYGSNILCSDKVYRDLVVIKISINDYVVRNEKIICGAGLGLFRLNNIAIKNGLSGLEWSYGIPGSVGGAVHMNAGCFCHEIKDVVDCVYYTDGEKIYKKKGNALEFSYRKSFFTNKNYIILKVVFVLLKDSESNIEKKCFSYYNERRLKQPYAYPSAGSIFKRPQDNFAPILIEQCGLKGIEYGGAMISKKHCGFIINNKKAKCKDVLKLIDKIKKTVFKKFGIMLEEEIIILR